MQKTRGNKNGLLSLEYMKERRLLAWTVQALIVCGKTDVKNSEAETRVFAKQLYHRDEEEGRIIVYRAYFTKVLDFPKPVRDQLMLELPALNGLRTGEVVTLRFEDVDFENGDLRVLDSKKHRSYLIPLDPQVAEHLDKFFREAGIREGLIFRRPRSGAQSKRPWLSTLAVGETWRKWCRTCGIPYMSPRYGRAYFAVNWHIVEGKSLIGLMDVLRHNDLVATQKYLAKIRSYEDVKAEFYRGKKWPGFQSKCAREACPLRVPGCYCRMFITKEVKNKK